jgi:crotonobetainyl-CoA:carnitine CoA-transferase CaiB-like acyl-CoA transferase
MRRLTPACSARLSSTRSSPGGPRNAPSRRQSRGAVGVPTGAVLDTQELIDEPSFYERGILQQMTHGERTRVMPTWPVQFDGVPTKVEPAPLLGEHIP